MDLFLLAVFILYMLSFILPPPTPTADATPDATPGATPEATPEATPTMRSRPNVTLSYDCKYFVQVTQFNDTLSAVQAPLMQSRVGFDMTQHFETDRFLTFGNLEGTWDLVARTPSTDNTVTLEEANEHAFCVKMKNKYLGLVQAEFPSHSQHLTFHLAKDERCHFVLVQNNDSYSFRTYLGGLYVGVHPTNPQLFCAYEDEQYKLRVKMQKAPGERLVKQVQEAPFACRPNWTDEGACHVRDELCVQKQTNCDGSTRFVPCDHCDCPVKTGSAWTDVEACGETKECHVKRKIEVEGQNCGTHRFEYFPCSYTGDFDLDASACDTNLVDCLNASVARTRQSCNYGVLETETQYVKCSDEQVNQQCCSVSDWEPWDECDQPCGDQGVQTSRREVTQRGAAKCDVETTKQRPCNRKPCNEGYAYHCGNYFMDQDLRVTEDAASSLLLTRDGARYMDRQNRCLYAQPNGSLALVHCDSEDGNSVNAQWSEAFVSVMGGDGLRPNEQNRWVWVDTSSMSDFTCNATHLVIP